MILLIKNIYLKMFEYVNTILRCQQESLKEDFNQSITYIFLLLSLFLKCFLTNISENYVTFGTVCKCFQYRASNLFYSRRKKYK